jgi:hypothetical protein
MVRFLAACESADVQGRVWLGCRIATPWSGRRTEREAPLAALRRLRTIVVHEIQELETSEALARLTGAKISPRTCQAGVKATFHPTSARRKPSRQRSAKGNKRTLRSNRTMPGDDHDLRRAEEHVAEARRIVHQQKGLIVRLKAAGINTSDAERILQVLQSNLKVFEEHRDALKKQK